MKENKMFGDETGIDVLSMIEEEKSQQSSTRSPREEEEMVGIDTANTVCKKGVLPSSSRKKSKESKDLTTSSLWLIPLPIILGISFAGAFLLLYFFFRRRISRLENEIKELRSTLITTSIPPTSSSSVPSPTFPSQSSPSQQQTSFPNHPNPNNNFRNRSSPSFMSPTQNQSCESLRQNPPTLPPISVNHISNVLTDSVAVTPRPKEDVKVILTDKEMDKELEKELAELGGVIENIKTKNVGKVLEVIETNKEEEEGIEIQKEEGENN